MSVVTTADEHYQKFEDHIEAAKAELQQVLDRNTWGAEEYDRTEILNKLLKLEEVL